MAEGATTVLSTIITSSMLNGVLSEIVGVLPIVLPVLVTFIGLRKAISFVRNILHSA